MSDDDNRLEKELKEVQLRFGNHPYLTIVSTEGSPVNKYIIEYRVKGLVRLDDGEIAKSDQHRVEISLSFGFPHFPPNCKPLTQIFHPDIDPSAIKIADFWSTDENLVSLIAHIGKMICWQVYSEENAFNPDAADWLVANNDSVPLDDVDFSGEQAAESPGTGGASDTVTLQEEAVVADVGLASDELPELSFDSDDFGESESSAAPAEPEEQEVSLDLTFDESVSSPQPDAPVEIADVAKDLDFGFTTPEIADDQGAESTESVVEEFDFGEAQQEEDAPADDVEGEVDLDFATVDVDYDILRGMVDQCNFFAAKRKISAMAPENLSEACAGLRPEIQAHIQDAEKLFQAATKLEKQGQLEEAAQKFEGVLNVARDYPELDQHMKRVRNAWMAESAPEAEVGQQAALEAQEPEPSPPPPPPAGADDSGSISLSLEREVDEDLPEADEAADRLAQEKAMASSLAEQAAPWKPPVPQESMKKEAAPVKVLPPEEKSKKPLFVALGAGLLLLLLSGMIFMEWTSVKKAKEEWSTVHVLLESGEYEQVNLKCTEITKLLGHVHLIMASQKKQLQAQVQDIVGSEHFQEAIGGKVYYNNKYISKRAHNAYLEIDRLVAEGEKKGSVSDWQGALGSYEAALAVAEENQKRLDEKFYNNVVFKVKQAQFAHHVAQGKKAFIAKSWGGAIVHFSKAMELAKLRDIADPTSSYDVNRYLQRARFSKFLIDGDAFLKKKNWKEAVRNYQGAHDIARKGDIIDRQSKKSVTLKLHQTTLMKCLTEGDKFTQAKKWKQAVAEYEKAESVLPNNVTIWGKSASETQGIVASSLLNALFNSAQEDARTYFAKKDYEKAVRSLKQSIRAINSSPLKNKAKWRHLKKQAEEDVKKASRQGVIEEKTAYLKEHYKEVFIENFVGVRAKALDQPQVKFLEATDSALVFRLRCREIRDLKYITLELIYQYDLVRDKWGFQGGD